MTAQRQEYEGFFCPVGADWSLHRKEATRAMKQIDDLTNTVGSIGRDTGHLSKLDEIVTALKQLSDHLVGPATGRKQVPISVCLLVCAVLGVSLMLVILDKTQKTVRIGGPGGIIEIVAPPEVSIVAPKLQDPAR